MCRSQAGLADSPVQLVQWLYGCVQRVDLEGFSQLVWAEARWDAAPWPVDAETPCPRGRGGAGLFAALLTPLLDQRAEVRQVVAQGQTVVVLGVLSAGGATATLHEGEFAHVWQVQEGRVQRVRLFTQATAVLAE